MGADIDGVIEARGPDGRWEMAADLLRFGLGRERYVWECLFGFGGSLGVDRPLFDQRGVPDDVSDPVPRTCGELHHGHSYATWAELAAVDWDLPFCDAPAWSWLGEWRPGPDGRPVLHDVVWARDELLEAAEEAFGEDLMPPEWPPGAGVRLDGAEYRPVLLTPRMFVPPDGDWGPVWAEMRALAAVHGDPNVRLVVWFG